MNKKLKDRLILESSLPGTLALLLEDESEVEEAQEYSRSALKAISSRLTKINSLVGSLPSGGYRSGLEALINKSVGDKLKGLAEKSKQLTDPDENLENAAKEAGVLANEIDEASKDINTVIKINLALMRYMASQILKANLHKGEDKDIPMEEILKEANLLDTSLKELGKAFDTAFKDLPGSKKGFFSKMADKLFGSEGESTANKLKENKDQVVKSILELTPLEIAKFAQSIVNYGKEDSKEAKKIEDEATEMAEKISNEAGVKNEDEDASATDDTENKGPSISKKEILSKAKEAAGDAGELVVTRLLKSDFFKDFNITESLSSRSLRMLVEKDISAEDYNALVAAAMEENEDAFKDVDTNSMAKELNKVFAASELDIKIEEKPPTWDDLDDKSKRRSSLGFYLDGRYIHGGAPSLDTFDTLLFSLNKDDFEREDLEDVDVDFNNTYSDQNGKGAPKLIDVPEFVNLVNKAAESNSEYNKFKIGDNTEADINLQAAKDESGDYYLVPIENKDSLKKAGFDLEESAKIMKRMRRMAGIL